MDEILASIRRIIDVGETQSKAPEPQVAEPAASIPPAPANDSGERAAAEATSVAPAPLAPRPALSPARQTVPSQPVPSQPVATQPVVPQSVLSQAPLTRRAPETARAMPDAEAPAKADENDIVAVVSAYLATEGATRAKPAAEPEAEIAEADTVDQSDADLPAAEPEAAEARAMEPAKGEPISAIDRDLLSGRKVKYDARFSEADDGVFRQVGHLLRETVEHKGGFARPALRTEASASLVSDAVSQSVSQSLANLSSLIARPKAPDLDAMAEDMLRPMLQDWLDNNLPSLVERLVRAEIERIARGEPRPA